LNFSADHFDFGSGEENRSLIRRMRGNVVIKAKKNGITVTLLKINDPDVTVEYAGISPLEMTTTEPASAPAEKV
jgi:hypothetical protein